MVTGRRPFNADTPLGSALQRITGPPPTPPRELNPACRSRGTTRSCDVLRGGPKIAIRTRWPSSTRSAPSLNAAPASSAGWQSRVTSGRSLARRLVAAILGRWRSAETMASRVRQSSPAATAADAALRPAVAVLGFQEPRRPPGRAVAFDGAVRDADDGVGGGGEGAGCAGRERQPDEGRARAGRRRRLQRGDARRASAGMWAPTWWCRARTSRSARAMTPRCASISAFRTRRKGRRRRCQRVRESGGAARRRVARRQPAARTSWVDRGAGRVASLRASQPSIARSGTPLCRRPDAPAPLRRARGARAARAGDSGRSQVPAGVFRAGHTWSALGYDSKAKEAAAQAFGCGHLSARRPAAGGRHLP